jgi:hypothetical protein
MSLLLGWRRALMTWINLNPEETIKELRRHGVEVEPNEDSSAGFSLKVGATGAAIPDWLFDNLVANSGEILKHSPEDSRPEAVTDEGIETE